MAQKQADSGRSAIRGYCAEGTRPWCRPYDRMRDLPRMLPIMARDLETPSPEAQARLVSLLRRALRAERVRGYQRHWTYDPGRHATLLRAYRIESARAPRLPRQLA